MNKITAYKRFVALGNFFRSFLQNYTSERLVWCIAAVGYCWCEVEDSVWNMFFKNILILIFLGSYYCVKMGLFQIKKLPFTIPVLAVGLYYCITFRYSEYRLMEVVFPVFLTVTVLLYILTVYDCFANKRIFYISVPCFILVLYGCCAYLSVNWAGYRYFYQILAIMPYSVIAKKEGTDKKIFSGIVDGVCIGFWLVQIYSWMHRPYNATDMRYKGATSLCIYAGRIYMLGFTAWLTKYVQLIKGKADFLWTSACWIISVFILSLLYLTGNRGSVAAVIFTATVIIGYRYYEKGLAWKEKAITALRWFGNLCTIGCLSLILFSMAYASVRYLPAFFDNPDYLDYNSDRKLSVIAGNLPGHEFDYNNEYKDLNIMQGDEIDSLKYVSYKESLTFNIGRLIPGLGDYFYDVFGEDLWYVKVHRIEDMYEKGFYSDEEYVWYNKELVSQFENKYVGGSIFADIGTPEQDVENDFSQPIKELFYKLITFFVLPVGAADPKTVPETYPGDTPDNPWSTREALQNGLGERLAIFSYAIRHMNMEGNDIGTFAFYQTESNVQGHAHNIFLQAGYDYGVPAMCIYVLAFGSVLIICFKRIFMEGQIEYLFTAGIFICAVIYGSFDVCISLTHGLHSMLFIMAVCLHMSKSKKLLNYKNSNSIPADIMIK